MTGRSAWVVSDGAPTQLTTGGVDYEEDLEDLIVRDPSLLGPGVRIIARQLRLEGGQLDLLALDADRLVVAELKQGAPTSSAVGQVLYYASVLQDTTADRLAEMIHASQETHAFELPTDLESILEQQTEVLSLVVGVGANPGTDHLVGHLASQYDVPIQMVSFEAFTLDDRQILTRQVIDPPPTPAAPARYSQDTIAVATGNESIFEQLNTKIADYPDHLHPRPWARCLMVAPTSNKTLALFTVWVDKTPARVGIAPGQIADRLGIELAVVRDLMDRHRLPSQGKDWVEHDLDHESGEQLIAWIDSLMLAVAPGEG
ncbi:MAG: DUF91 domain-containing protein [bacterium]|nr:DUF91 domain-containing protein [bacterium]